MILFDSLNPYESLEVVIGDDPEALVKRLKAIITPVKIVAIVPYGTRHAAYVLGDVRKNETRPKKTTKTSTGEK